jgi:predicted alpha/beta superfamily hydrolase
MYRTGLAAIGMILVLFAAGSGGQTRPCKSTVVGLDIVELTSRVFHNERYLRVWLPPGYSDPANAGKQYPALYMMDGQILFDGCTATRDGVTEWRIDETLTQLITEGSVPPLIVIGVDHMGASRPYEFLPYRDTVSSPDSPFPAGQQFPEFLARDVVPLITTRYRVIKGPQAIGGSSYGAVAALHSLISRPDLFNMGLIESPSLAVGNGQLLRDTEHLFRGPTKMFLGAGDSEFGIDPAASENVGYVRMLRVLESNVKGAAQSQSQVLTVIQPAGKHSLQSWALRFPQAIQFLYTVTRP